MKTIILVAGVSRSGTSIMSRVLQELGMNLGQNIDTAPVTCNRSGYWEHKGGRSIQEKLLSELGHPWDRSHLPLPPRWIEWPETQRAMKELEKIVRSELIKSSHWVFKDPRSSRLIPLWIQIANRLGVDLKVLSMIRHPEEVAASFYARDSTPKEKALKIWRRINCDLIEASKLTSIKFISSEKLFSNPSEVISLIRSFCPFFLQQEQCDRAIKLIDPDLRHHANVFSSSKANSPEELLYEIILKNDQMAIVNEEPLCEQFKYSHKKIASMGRVLIVLRSHWREHFIPRALRSILSQTYDDWILQIVNNGGPVKSLENVIKPYRKVFGDKLHIIHLEQEVGIECASNLAIKLHQSEFITIHDDDDSWMPNFLEKTVERIVSSEANAVATHGELVHEEVIQEELITSRVEMIDPPMDRIEAMDLNEKNLFPPISLLFKRSAYEKAGQFDERFRVLGDWDFNKRLASIAGIEVLKENLMRHHRHSGGHGPGNTAWDEHRRWENFRLNKEKGTSQPPFHSNIKQIPLQISREEIASLFPPTSLHVTPHSELTIGTDSFFHSNGTDPQLLLKNESTLLASGLYLFDLEMETDGCSGSAQLLFDTGGGFSQGDSVTFGKSSSGRYTALINSGSPIISFLLRPFQGSGKVRIECASISYISSPLPVFGGFSRRPRLPDVLCIGAQKSGTTWLYEALQNHRKIWKSSIKEYHFFDNLHNGASQIWHQRTALSLLSSAKNIEDVQNSVNYGFFNHLDWKWYSSLFQKASLDLKVCDFTPAYAVLEDDSVREIAKKLPDLKVIYLLRDPVIRSISSAYHNLRLRGNISPTLEEIENECFGIQNQTRSDYQTTINRWRRYFPKDQIHIEFFDDIYWSPSDVTNRISNFLGIETSSIDEEILTAVLNPGLTTEVSADLVVLKYKLSLHFLNQLEWLAEEFGGVTLQWLVKARARVEAHDAASRGSGSSGKNNYINNLAQWDSIHPWTKDGDEWFGQAKACGISYDVWKQSIIDRYFTLFKPGGTFLEIGPGHGRWTQYLAEISKKLIIVDTSPNCLDFCQRKLLGKVLLRSYLSKGSDLPSDMNAQVDGIWSFDCFVHVSPEDFKSYLLEIGRVLRPGAHAIIHYAESSSKDFSSFFKFNKISHEDKKNNGWRSYISTGQLNKWLRQSGLIIIKKEKVFGISFQSGVPRFGDQICVLEKL